MSGAPQERGAEDTAKADHQTSGGSVPQRQQNVTTTKPPWPRTVPIERVEDLAETRHVRARGIDSGHVDLMLPFVADLPPIDVVALSGGRYGIWLAITAVPPTS